MQITEAQTIAIDLVGLAGIVPRVDLEVARVVLEAGRQPRAQGDQILMGMGLRVGYGPL